MRWSLFCHINVRLAYTVVGIVLGLFWSTIYIGWWKNWVALATCLTATAFAVETLFLYWSVKIDTILKWKPQTFQWLFWINLLVGFLAIAGMIVAIVLAATNHQGVSNKDQHGLNWWSTATWFLVMLKWTWQNAFFARLYAKKTRISVVRPDSPEDDPAVWKF
uniref:Uncharacterized protein n=1 Tax=Caenorhabditis japonica TaxID=281687 RepID=A0A8R1EY80_CAEJA